MSIESTKVRVGEIDLVRTRRRCRDIFVTLASEFLFDLSLKPPIVQFVALENVLITVQTRVLFSNE